MSSEDMRRFRIVEGVFRDCCEQAGYAEVRTPTVEYLHLFTMAGTLTPDRLSRVYSFLDWDGWSGERVVLRPDGTIPIARLYVDSLQDQGLAKLFYITNVFVFEETGTKARERWQCGAELIGAGSPLADVELISLAAEALHGMGCGGMKLRLSHVGLVKALLAELGLQPGEQMQVFDRLMDGDMGALSGIKPQRKDLKRALTALFELKGKSSGFLQNFKAILQGEMPQLAPYIDDFIGVVAIMDTLDYNYEIDVASGAGFEYYTGIAFEVLLEGEKVGGGGRYDGLIPLVGGGKVPASGFALYMDRLMARLSPAAGEPMSRRIMVQAKGEVPEAVRQMFTVARQLRESGYVVELDSGDGETGAFRWLLDVGNGKLPYVLIDNVDNTKAELLAMDGIMAWLEGKGDAQAGAA